MLEGVASTLDAARAAAQRSDSYVPRIRVLMVGALLALATFVVVGALVIRDSVQRRQWVAHGTQVQLGAERLRTQLMGAGRSAQQAMLEGRSAAQAVAALRAGARADLARLRQLVLDNAEQAQRLEALAPMVERRFDLLLDLMQSSLAANPLLADPQMAARLRVVQDIEARLDEFRRAEEALRVQREAALERSSQALGVVMIAIASLALALLTLAWRWGQRELARRVASERLERHSAKNLKLVNASLEQHVADRTAALRERNEQLARMHERLSAVSTRLVRVAEEERRTLARELHDDLGQQLAAVKMNLQVLQRFPGDAATAATRLTDSVQLVEGCIAQVRERALDLRPAMLDELGLADALRWHAGQQASRAGVPITVRADPGVNRYADAWASAVYRIVQEALRNALAHAGASAIDVALERDDGGIVLRVRDNGRGLAPQGSGRSGMGLSTMRERCALLGGEFELRAVQPHGTEVVCRWDEPMLEAGIAPPIDPSGTRAR